jgi:hypothetical protein
MSVTGLKDVELVLRNLDTPLAKEWLHNDIVKMKLAVSYDDWMNDSWDHGHECTLREHIIDMINLPGFYPGT